MVKSNNKLWAFAAQYKFNKILKDLYEYPDVKGLYICELTKLDRNNGNATVYVNTLGFSVTTQLFYHKTVELGDTLLIYLDTPNEGKVLGLHCKSSKYKDEPIQDTDVLKVGSSEISIKNNSIVFNIGDTEYVFQSNGMSVLSEELMNNFQVNLPSLTNINVQDLDIVGSSIDVKLGSLTSLTKKVPFLSSRPSGLSINSMFGNIDVVSSVGNVNISSMLSTNVSGGVNLNLLSGGIAGIFAPFISNLTPGFGFPLIPSPTPLVSIPETMNNYLNPFRTPMLNSATHILNKARIPLP